jgi:choline-glycine betaine transporter
MFIFLVFGPTSYIFNLGTQSFGSFLNNFIEGMTFTDPFNGSELWPQWWDMYYLTWWLSFGPIVGLFLIKLCYGRTIREFIIVNWILPASFGILWFSVFGGFVLDLQINKNIDVYGYMLLNGTQSVMLKLFDYLPFSQSLRIFALVIIFISFVTMADSLTSTISLMSIKKSESYAEAPIIIKLFWGILMGTTAVVLTLSGGIDSIKTIGVLTGFPILFLGISMIVSFLVYFIKHPKDIQGNYIEEEALYNEKLINVDEIKDKNFQLESEEK